MKTQRDFLNTSTIQVATLDECLSEYSKMVWVLNQLHNLTGEKSEEIWLNNHVLDSWIGFLVWFFKVYSKKTQEERRSSPIHFIDVGSGAGVPGFVWALAGEFLLQSASSFSVELIEPRRVKMEALERMHASFKSREKLSSLRLNSGLWENHQRSELTLSSASLENTWVLMKAFLPGAKLFKYLVKFFDPKIVPSLVLFKGPSWSQELKDIESEFQNKVPSLQMEAWWVRFKLAQEIEYELPVWSDEQNLFKQDARCEMINFIKTERIAPPASEKQKMTFKQRKLIFV